MTLRLWRQASIVEVMACWSKTCPLLVTEPSKGVWGQRGWTHRFICLKCLCPSCSLFPGCQGRSVLWLETRWDAEDSFPIPDCAVRSAPSSRCGCVSSLLYSTRHCWVWLWSAGVPSLSVTLGSKNTGFSVILLFPRGRYRVFYGDILAPVSHLLLLYCRHCLWNKETSSTVG